MEIFASVSLDIVVTRRLPRGNESLVISVCRDNISDAMLAVLLN